MQPGHPGYPGYPPNPGPGPYGAGPPAGGYGAPMQHGFGPPPPPPMTPGYGYGGYGMPMMNQKNPGLAVALELIFGMTFQTFGIGHIYAGNTGVGLAWMFGYWAVTALNFVLMMVLVGFITWPLCWIAAMIISSITAATAARNFNDRMMRGMAY